MTNVVNLNKARKAQAKSKDLAKAAQNRVAFGRSKPEKTKARSEKVKSDRALDGAKRED